jgi:hypothetical protein
MKGTLTDEEIEYLNSLVDGCQRGDLIWWMPYVDTLRLQKAEALQPLVAYLLTQSMTSVQRFVARNLPTDSGPSEAVLEARMALMAKLLDHQAPPMRILWRDADDNAK